jgi:hypothetical protein
MSWNDALLPMIAFAIGQVTTAIFAYRAQASARAAAAKLDKLRLQAMERRLKRIEDILTKKLGDTILP